MLEDALQAVHGVASSEWGRLIATLLVCLVGTFVIKSLQRFAVRRTGHTHVRREQLVWSKNLVLVLCAIAVFSIWASKLAGFALTFVALASAVLIVSKEFLTNLIGYAVLTASRNFRIGDYIEVNGIRGRVVDTDLLATTLAETQTANQLTGSTVAIPNALWLSHPVRNLTATGSYIVQILTVAVDLKDDILAVERHLLAAAREVCGDWLVDANEHLQRIENKEMIDLPSAEPRVLLDFNDSKAIHASLRYVCTPNNRVKVEQEILRKYWTSLTHEKKEKADEQQ